VLASVNVSSYTWNMCVMFRSTCIVHCRPRLMNLTLVLYGNKTLSLTLREEYKLDVCVN
jgi:hypothetical protein